MSTAKRRQHNAGFKAKVAMDALKDEETVAEVGQSVWNPSSHDSHVEKDVAGRGGRMIREGKKG